MTVVVVLSGQEMAKGKHEYSSMTVRKNKLQLVEARVPLKSMLRRLKGHAAFTRCALSGLLKCGLQSAQTRQSLVMSLTSPMEYGAHDSGVAEVIVEGFEVCTGINNQLGQGTWELIELPQPVHDAVVIGGKFNPPLQKLVILYLSRLLVIKYECHGLLDHEQGKTSAGQIIPPLPHHFNYCLILLLDKGVSDFRALEGSGKEATIPVNHSCFLIDSGATESHFKRHSKLAQDTIRSLQTIEDSSEITEMQFNPEIALKAMQQQLETFECLRQQTLLNASLVQSQINEIFNGINLEDGSYEFTPKEQAANAPESPQLLKERTEHESNVSQLEEERRVLQGQLSETEDKRKFYTDQIKTLLSKYEDLQKQNQTLQADREQLIIENQRINRQLEKIVQEREDLLVVIDAKETVLQIEKNKEASGAIKVNALQMENQKLSHSRSKIKSEVTFLKKELEKASCEIQCIKAKNAVVGTKNLMLFQLVQELKDKNHNLERSLQNTAASCQPLQRVADEGQMDNSTMKARFSHDAASQEEGSSESRTSALARKCETLSKIMVLLTEENQMLSQELEKYLTASSLLEVNGEKLGEEWLLSEKCAGIREQEINNIIPESEKRCSYYSSCAVNNAAQLHRQGNEDKKSNQPNYSHVSFISSRLCAGDGSIQVHQMPLCSSPKDQSNIDEVRKGFEELEGEQGDNIQYYNPLSLHMSITDWEIQSHVSGTGDVSPIANEQNFPLFDVKKHSRQSDVKSTSALSGGKPSLEKEIHWKNKDLDSCINETPMKTR
ncbi:putative leucine-rich repeat-containing protein DDB_G0290503 [Narcine bancroftii]|uniref:putative leucine-rich repeat-containing protein DDB_G0290503 n=1 Tax=Narcine bancroftii TaxID=1343680 RepID=UPI003831D363